MQDHVDNPAQCTPDAVIGRSLPCDDGLRWGHFDRGVIRDAIVENDDLQEIQKLPLVFVDSLDLAVEDGRRIDRLSGGFFDPCSELRSELLLGSLLRLEKLVLKCSIVRQR